MDGDVLNDYTMKMRERERKLEKHKNLIKEVKKTNSGTWSFRDVFITGAHEIMPKTGKLKLDELEFERRKETF